MEISEITFHRPSSVSEACALAHKLGGRARFLAGGTDLLVDLKQRRLTLDHLISINELKELKGIRVDGDGLHIGALTTMTELAQSDDVRRHAPALAEAALSMGMVQIRNRASIGGNFGAAVPCADTPPICIAYGAEVKIVGAKGERRVKAESFFVGPRQTVLEPGELLVEILVPQPNRKSGAAYHRFARRRSASLAVAGVAASLTLNGEKVSVARVALTSVAPTPLFVPAIGKLLVGQKPSAELLARAAKAAADAAKPITDLRGSEVYRRDLVETLTGRALRDALTRARNN